MDRHKQQQDVEKAMKNYEKHADKMVEKGDLSVQGAVKNIYNRKNLLDQLGEDMKNAGRSRTDRMIYGK
jgi:phage tail tape-measure protein